MTNHQQQQQQLLLLQEKEPRAFSDLEYKSNDVGHLLDFFSDVVDEGEGEGGDEVGKPLEQNAVDDESMVAEPTTTTTPATTTQATTASSSFEESVESTRTDTTEAPVVVVVEPEPASTAALPQEKELVETSTEEKEVAISIYSTSHPCANDGTATTATADDSEENGMMEQLVQFDYDLVLSSSTFAVEQSSNDINSILQQLEEQLLDHVGVALEGVGLCGSGSSSSGGGVRRTSDRKMLRRRRRSLLAADENGEGGTILEEISSLPMDDVLANATCSKENLPTSSSTTTSTTACYPISGYMTAYYYNTISDTATESSTTSRADDITETAIYDIIQRSMTESTITNDLTATNNNGDTVIANVHFVGVRGTSLEEQQLGNPSPSNNGMIFNPNTKPQPSSSSLSSMSSNGMLIGTIIGGLLAVVAVFMLAFVAVRRSLATNVNHDDDYDDDLRSHDGTSQDEDAERAGEITMHLPPTSMIISSSWYNNNAGVPSYNESNDAYHRREEEQQRQRQQHQWLSRSLTSETDMTPVVSNVKRSRRQQRQQQQRHVAEQTIQECGGDGESEW